MPFSTFSLFYIRSFYVRSFSTFCLSTFSHSMFSLSTFSLSMFSSSTFSLSTFSHSMISLLTFSLSTLGEPILNLMERSGAVFHTTYILYTPSRKSGQFPRASGSKSLRGEISYKIQETRQRVLGFPGNFPSRELPPLFSGKSALFWDSANTAIVVS